MALPYPGDTIGQRISEALFADYAEANVQPNSGMGVWLWRCAWDIGQNGDVEQTIAKHRREWRLALGLTNPNQPTSMRLHIEGRRFVDEAGSEWVWKGTTDFLLGHRLANGENITPIIEQRMAAGANVFRVLGMAHNIADFILGWVGLVNLAGLLRTYNAYLELTVFADAQYKMPSQLDQRTHFDLAVAALRNEPNVFLELVNEYPQNGVSPAGFIAPHELLAAQGSGLGDRGPAWPGWSYHTFHERRDWPKVIGAAVDGFDISTGLPYFENGVARVYKVAPIVFDEGIGFAEFDQPGRRSTDSRLARLMALSYRLLGAGGTFHSEAGLRSELWGPIQQQCAVEFYRGLQ